MWEEIISEESEKSCESNSGLWKNHLCYWYEIVTNICFYITEDSNNHDIDDNDWWKVTRGCYGHDRFTKHVRATPNLWYGFSQVKIEAWLDPYPPLTTDHDHDIAASIKPSGWTKLFSFLMYATLTASILSLAVYGFILFITL